MTTKKAEVKATPTTIEVRMTESYSTWVVHESMEINIADYPELEGMTEDEMTDYITSNASDMKSSNEEWYDSLYEELKPYSTKISSSKSVSLSFNNKEACSYSSLIMMSSTKSVSGDSSNGFNLSGIKSARVCKLPSSPRMIGASKEMESFSMEFFILLADDIAVARCLLQTKLTQKFLNVVSLVGS